MSGRAYLAGAAYSGRRGTAVLFDQDHTAATYGLADRLVEDFERLILVTPRPHFAQAVNYCSAIGVHRRLHGAGVDLIPAMRPSRFGNGRLDLQNVYADRSRTIENVDLLIYVTPRHVPETEIWEMGDIEVHRVGDCRSPRNLMAAIHGGHLVALGV
jgi:dimethylglycine catabolism A